MAPHPRELSSSGATTLMIAIVVIGVLVLGMLAMVGLGLWFFVLHSDVEPVVTEIEFGEAGIVEQWLAEAPLTEAETLDRPPVVIEPDRPAPTDPGNMSETAPQADSLDSPDASEPVAEPLVQALRRSLTELTPLEVLDIRLGDGALVRPAKVAGRNYPTAIWAQPEANLGTCQVSFPLKQAFQQLTGTAAVADTDAQDAAVPKGTFRIYGDGNLLWDSGTLEGYGSTKAFEVIVEGIRLVVLVVESDSPSDVSRFAWVDLQLVAKPSSGMP
jgi:hypothetical protein